MSPGTRSRKGIHVVRMPTSPPPPAGGDERSTTNLPPEAGGFVGRVADRAAIQALFERGERLVTITGPGGIGKTRLATRAARDHLETFPNGVWLCDLTDARDLRGVCAAVGDALDVPPGPSESDQAAAVRIGHALAACGPVLVVLDNFEQVVEVAPSTVTQWRSMAPEARFLVTSRERLRLPGEAARELEPLSVPEGDADVHESEAVQLFVERVRRLRPDWDPSPTEAPLVAAIVARLDGIPLAIELAAARMGMLGPASLVERLSKGLDVLGHGARDASARQRTLRGAIDWSWNLLEPAERAALAQASVFRGGLDVTAAEAVISLAGVRGAPSVMEVIQSLRDKSLLRVWAAPELDGELRLGMYASIRDYAAERLDEMQSGDATRLRHATHYVTMGDALAAQMDGRGGTQARIRLMLEQENLLAVVEWAIATTPSTREAATIALGAMRALDPLFGVRGLFTLQISLYDLVLSTFGSELGDPLERARALEQRGLAHATQGTITAAMRDLEEALAIARKHKGRKLEGRVLRDMARALQNKPVEAQAHYRAAIEIQREVGDRRYEGLTLNGLAAAQHLAGNIEEARLVLRQCLDIFREVGDERWEGIVLCQTGTMDLETGRLDAAEVNFEKARALSRGAAGWNLEAVVTQSLALLHHARGRIDDARREYEATLKIYRRVVQRAYEGMYMGYLAVCEREAGNLALARENLERCRAILLDVGEQRHGAMFLAHLAGVEAGLGAIEDAVSHFDEAERVLADADDPLVRAVIELERGHLDLARAVRARAAAKNDDARALREKARERFRKIAVMGVDAGVRSIAEQSVDVRLSLRVLERALDADRTGDVTPAMRSSEAETDALVVHRDGRWFRVPGGEPVTCTTRHVARRLLLKLAERRREAPGVPVSGDELFEAGWPGERVIPQAARNRLHVALATLRKLGLRDLLRSSGDGYLLDAEIPLRFVHDRE